MDAATLNEWRRLIKKLLTELAAIPYSGKVAPKAKTVFDEGADAYLVVVEGWDGVLRLHGCVAHVEIRGDKIWILLDGTEHAGHTHGPGKPLRFGNPGRPPQFTKDRIRLLRRPS